MLFAALCVVVMANAVITPILWVQIQHSRQDSIRRACVEQNARYDGTVHALDQLIANVKRTDPARAKRAGEGRASTILLISALAPRRDCRALVARLTQ